MEMDELRRYELYIVLQPELDSEQLEECIERMNNYLTGHNGEIIEVVRKGKRRLAYPINKLTQGIDIIYQTNLPSRSMGALERQLNFNEDVIRYLCIRRDDLSEGERMVASQEQIAADVAALQAQPTDLDLSFGEQPKMDFEAQPTFDFDAQPKMDFNDQPLSFGQPTFEPFESDDIDEEGEF